MKCTNCQRELKDDKYYPNISCICGLFCNKECSSEYHNRKCSTKAIMENMK